MVNKGAIVLLELRAKNADLNVEPKELSLDESGIGRSNTVKINGRDIMDVLGEKQRVLTACPSCMDLIGKETGCNSYIYKGKIYDSLPKEMLREALYREIFGEDTPVSSQG